MAEQFLLQAEQLYGVKKESIYTVTQLTNYIRKKIRSDNNLIQIYVLGEITDISKPSSGHIYFSLKDESSLLSCAFFRQNNKTLAFGLEQGMEVLCFGSLTIYEDKSTYQLDVASVYPVGEGALWLKFKQTKEKLEREGLFDEKRKRKVPAFATRIGLIASKGSEAYHDVIVKLKERLPIVTVLFASSSMQGDYAPNEVIRALSILNESNADVIIIARGGGSIEDLMCFNNEDLAYAISKSRIPIISGVGHAEDFTIVDFVVDKRATTPTNAAEIAVPDKNEVIERIETLKHKLKKSYENYLKVKHKEKELEIKEKALKKYKIAIAVILIIIIVYFIIKELLK